MTAAPFPSTQQASGRHVLPRLVLQQLAGQAVTGTALYTGTWRQLLDRPKLHLLRSVALDNGAAQEHLWLVLEPYTLKVLRPRMGEAFRFRASVTAYQRSNGSWDWTFNCLRVEG
ncbi:MAG: hypothetical protein AB7V46_21915 [Thermomicrobiales bacterium]